MAQTLNEKTRLCEITSSGIIPELGCISAPIRHCKLTDAQVTSILKRGFKIFEYDPSRLTSEKKELDVRNGGISPFAESSGKRQKREDIVLPDGVIIPSKHSSDKHEVTSSISNCGGDAISNVHESHNTIHDDNANYSDDACVAEKTSSNVESSTENTAPENVEKNQEIRNVVVGHNPEKRVNTGSDFSKGKKNNR